MKNTVYENEVLRLKKNDISALKWFYVQYSEKLYYNAMKITKDHHLSKDIVQDVFIKLWDKRATIDPSKPILNWLFVVSYHHAVDCLKIKLRSSLRDWKVTSDIPQSTSEEIEEKKKKEANFEVLSMAISNLSNQKRRVVELCKIQGKTYELAAKEMSISKYTVKEYLSGAMKNIKDFVQEEFY